MNDEQILSGVIEKVDKDGYIWLTTPDLDKQIKDYLKDKRYYGIIFSHAFVKKFWGEELVCEKCDELRAKHKGDRFLGPMPCSYWIPCWMSELKKLVIQEEPLRYLERFLK